MHDSQLRTLSPPSFYTSSCISKQWQVGQTYAQVEQLRQGSDIPGQQSSLKSSSTVLSFTLSVPNWTVITSSAFFLSTISASIFASLGSLMTDMPATSSLPFL